MQNIKVCISLAFLLIAGRATGQVTINGHQPCYDRNTESLLFNISADSLYDLTADVTTDDTCRWQDVRIDGKAIGSQFPFGDVSKDRSFLLTATLPNDSAIHRNILFTSLPVLDIHKATAFTDDYSSATFSLLTSDSVAHYNCVIKHRGGSTNTSDRHKRNYKLKIQNAQGKNLDVSLLGMRKDKSWILDAGQIDLFRLRNNVCHNLWVDFSTSPYYKQQEPKLCNGCHAKVVEVFINNEYRGIYSLMEPVDKEQLCLKKYSAKKGGVRGLLYKTSSWDHTSFYYDFTDAYDNKSGTWYGWEAQYPEPGDDADTTDWKPLDEFNRMVSTETDKNFYDEITQKLDMPVYRDYVLFINLINGIDNVGKNMYWSLYDGGEDNKFVPTPWDMDATFGQWYTDADTSMDSTWLSPTREIGSITNIDRRLYNLSDPDFAASLKERWADLRSTFFSQDALLERFKNVFQTINENGAVSREEAKWSEDSDIGGLKLDMEGQLNYILKWIPQRLAFLDKKYNYSSATDILKVYTSNRNVERKGRFNILGQSVDDSYHGIVISGGKKILR